MKKTNKQTKGFQGYKMADGYTMALTEYYKQLKLAGFKIKRTPLGIMVTK